MTKNLQHIKKHLAAYVRKGDFSHPGNTEAIDKIMHHVITDKHKLILDVGCGFGGTAQYIKDHGYGNPIGIDIDFDNINYAKKTYPDISFHQCDVLDSEKLFEPQKFDIICLISSFLLFTDQQSSLSVLSNLAKPNATLVLFDYTQAQNYAEFCWSCDHNPINPDNIANILSNSGWQIEKFVDMSSEFLLWYNEFSENIVHKSNELIAQFGIDAYNNFFVTYHNYQEFYRNKMLGGATIIARKTI